jgi:hypothetical protein
MSPPPPKKNDIGIPVGKFLFTKFEFGGNFGMSVEGDCHEVEVTPKLQLEEVCHKLFYK